MITSQGGCGQFQAGLSALVGSSEAILPARTGTSQWPDVQGEHQEEQKPRADALQDQDAVSPVEAGLKYQCTFVL